MSIFEKCSNFPCLSWLALKYLLPLVTALVFMPHILSISISVICVDMILSRLACMSMRWEGFPLLFLIAKLLILVFLRAPIIRMRVITTTNQTPLRITRYPNWEHKKFNNIQMAEYWFFFYTTRQDFPNNSTAKIFIGRSRDCIFRKKTHIFISFRLADTATVMNREKILFLPCVFITQSPTYILPGNKSENLTKKLSTKIGLCPRRETNRSVFQSMENSLFCA